MTIPESITVSLEWAKKLKEARWPQDESFMFMRYMTNPEDDRERSVCEVLLRKSGNEWHEDNEYAGCLAAPTAEEILRRLPRQIPTEDFFWSLRIIASKPNGWALDYRNHTGIEITDYLADHAKSFEADTLANAAAALWIYLKENNLLPS